MCMPIKPAVGVYTGRPGPADLCIYDIVDGTRRPFQVSKGLPGLFSFAPRGDFRFLSILHGSTWPGVPVGRVRRPGGLGFVYHSGLAESSGRNSTTSRYGIVFRICLMFSKMGKITTY